MAETFEQAVNRIIEQIDEEHPPWKASPPERLYGFARAVAKWQASRDAEICNKWPLSCENMLRMQAWKGDKGNAVAGVLYECGGAILKAAEEL